MKNPTSRTLRKTSSGTLIALSVLFLLFSVDRLVSQEVPGSGFNRDLSLDLIAEAREAIERGDPEAARFLLLRAYAIDPAGGDALYLLAELEPHVPDTVAYRERLLRRSRELTLLTVSPDEPVSALSRILIDTGRAREAVGILDHHVAQRDGRGSVHAAMNAVLAPDIGEPLPATVRSPAALDILFLEALLNDDPGWFASEVLGHLRSRYPEDVQIAILDWRRAEVLSPALLEWLGSVVREAPAEIANAELFSEVLRTTLDLLPRSSPGIREPLTTFYYRRGGDDAVPAAKLLATGRFPVEMGEQLREIVDRAAKSGEKRVWEAVARIVPPSGWPDVLPEPLRTTVTDLSAVSEPITLYRKSPGVFAREWYTLEQGRLQQWREDIDGNGRVDRAVEFGRNETRLYQRLEDRILVIEFSRYPLVTQASLLAVAPPTPERPAAWSIVPPAERIDAYRSRRWVPAQPVPFDPELRIEAPFNGSVLFGDSESRSYFELPAVLSGRIDFGPRLQSRFERQFSSANARRLSEFEEEQNTRYLRAMGLLR